MSGAYDTLVIYNFGYWDPEHLGNFNYFIKHGIRGNDGARYAIILEHLIATELLDLPPFPSNVQVCFWFMTVHRVIHHQHNHP